MTKRSGYVSEFSLDVTDLVTVLTATKRRSSVSNSLRIQGHLCRRRETRFAPEVNHGGGHQGYTAGPLRTMTRVLVFEVWGEYGHFRKHYTTTSPLTFSIPSRTALTGLLGAIIGLSKEEYLGHFRCKQAQIGYG
jgi:CRISPR-associated Cas5-like protein